MLGVHIDTYLTLMLLACVATAYRRRQPVVTPSALTTLQCAQSYMYTKAGRCLLLVKIKNVRVSSTSLCLDGDTRILIYSIGRGDACMA